MIETLKAIDLQLFYMINGDFTNAFLDVILPPIRNKYFWAPLYIFIIVFVIKEYKVKGIFLILFLLISFALSDFLSAGIIKPIVQRIRPCNDVSLTGTIRNLVDCGPGFSFVSAHASNHFAIATFLILSFYARWKGILLVGLIWAAAICYAQVYVGVHYPFDVICGAGVGAFCGWITYKFFKQIILSDSNGRI